MMNLVVLSAGNIILVSRITFNQRVAGGNGLVRRNVSEKFRANTGCAVLKNPNNKKAL